MNEPCQFSIISHFLASPVPGVVRVVVLTQTGQYIGEIEYTYEEEEDEKLLNKVKNIKDSRLLSEIFFTLVEKMKNHTISADDSAASSNLLSQLFNGGMYVQYHPWKFRYHES